MRAFGFRVCASAFSPVHVFSFFFFWPAFVDFGRQILLLWTVNALFTHCADTVHILKMDLTVLFTHLKIILLQCFQFSVSATISSIQTDPIPLTQYFPQQLRYQVFSGSHMSPLLISFSNLPSFFFFFVYWFI